MAIDTTYGPEVGQIVKIMAKKPEGVVLRYPEIEEIIKLPVANPQFHRILSTAINRLAQQKIPVKKVRNSRKINLSGGIVRISPGDKIQHSYDRQIKGLNRTADNAFRDINTVDVSALTQVEQTIAFAVDATAKMTQLMATENTQDKLRAEIKNVGDKITDVKTAFAKLMSHNL